VLGDRESILVPDVAVMSDQTGRFVYLVGSDGTVSRRNVTAGPVIDRLRRIDEGLSADDTVVVNGVQRARPGGKVNAVAEKPAATPSPSPAAPAKG
jgi:multidrug efflux system membrane fusion protein